jgi:hypothetical protein
MSLAITEDRQLATHDLPPLAGGGGIVENGDKLLK